MLTALAFALAAASSSLAPGPGISESLANDRAGAIQSLSYLLSFKIPEKKTEAIRGSETIRFELRAARRVVLDFEQPRDHVLEIRAGGTRIHPAFAGGHLIIPASSTRAGANAISIDFIAGNESLNRNDDFLYTLFVPSRAHLAFPCFDQPNLKARYQLTLEIPAGWQAVANGAEVADPVARADGLARTFHFAETQPLSTYLFAFAAGKFTIETAERDGRTFRMFVRETDAAKIQRNREAIFDLHARAIAWLEEYTAIKYPWGKFDFVLLPSFQFGGMEHAGAIFYNQASLLLDESATGNQLLGRASVISHETAHMWFGDLVTMRWFNDVWMKEVLANFMAAKIVNPSFPDVNHPLRFLLQHFPSAYAVDRTAGANPIRQELANLNDAGSLYGNIIYDKAPIAMRQLELLVGEEDFRAGLREYLKQFSFGNATWLDLVRILDRHTSAQVSPWSRAWIELRGRPEITATLAPAKDGAIPEFRLTEHDPLKRGLSWPQLLRVTAGYPDRVQQWDVSINSPVTNALPPEGLKQPLYVIPNGAGLGYGLFLLDESTRGYLLKHIANIPDALIRGSAWVDMWENLLAGQVAPEAFLDMALGALPKENDEQNVERVLGYMSGAFWRFLPPADRAERAPAIEKTLREGIARAPASSQKSAWFNAFRDMVLTKEGLAWLQRVWRRDEKIEGIAFAETDEINMALELAVREVPDSDAILATQHDRTRDPDRKARFEFVRPALSADPAVRVESFERFRKLENRRHEPWVLEALRYLNHPLRETQARQFILPSLELLPEIQRTGDIFFPKRWLDTTLSGHRSPEDAGIVRQYLASHPALPERLKWDVLASADELFRASRTKASAGQ